MIRRYNYTDRLKVPRENIRITWIEEPGGFLAFRCEINLELDRLLDPAGLVFVEAYSKADVMRFSFGTVQHREPPADLRLTEFPPGLKPFFRLRIVEPAGGRRILAWADQIVALSPEEVASGRRSILPVETVDLGARIWNLRIEANHFFLQLNSGIRDIGVVAREPDFIGLVYPAVIRQILGHLLFGPEREAVEPTHDWLIYAGTLAGRTAPVGDDAKPEFAEEAEEWISAAVTAFCEQQHAAENFIKHHKEEETTTHG